MSLIKTTTQVLSHRIYICNEVEFLQNEFSASYLIKLLPICPHKTFYSYFYDKQHTRHLTNQFVVTQRVPLEEQKILRLSEHPIFSVFRVAQSYVFCGMFCGPLFVFFVLLLSSIVLTVLRITAANSPLCCPQTFTVTSHYCFLYFFRPIILLRVYLIIRLRSYLIILLRSYLIILLRVYLIILLRVYLIILLR